MENDNLLEQIENGTSADRVIEIKSIYKNGKTIANPAKNPLNGWYHGVERLSEDDKKHRQFWAEPTSKFILKEGVILNLDNEEHKVIWDWVKFLPCLAFSYDECQRTPEAEFYVHLKNKETAISVSIKELKYKAFDLIMNDNPANYPLKAKLLGVNMDGESSVLAIKDFLLDRAEADPAEIIRVYEDKLILLRTLVIQAVEKNKIKIDTMGGYRYGNIFMGMDEDSAVHYLNSMENVKVRKLLEQEINPEYYETDNSTDGIVDLPRH